MSSGIQIEDYIRAVPDFPKPGILFRDISPLLANPAAFDMACRELSSRVASCMPTIIAGIESRGFIFGVPVAQRLSLPFIPIRKPGKLPGETISVSYELEYGIDSLEMHRDAVASSDRVVIIDDLLATGGTAAAAKSLVEKLGANVAALGFLIELTGLNGREPLGETPSMSLLKY